MGALTLEGIIVPCNKVRRHAGLEFLLAKMGKIESKQRMLMPLWLKVVILGAIEGVTEFLPISSTGHLLIAEHYLGHRSDVFNVVIQTGAVLAVLLVFTRRIRQLLVQWREKASQEYMAKLAAAFVITGIGGLLLKRAGFKLPETDVPVAWATLIGGVLFIMVEWWLRGKPMRQEVTWGVALAVGASQLLAAVFPGASRSGTTILMALVLGLARPPAVEFSFLLGIPTLLAAGGLEAFEGIRHPPPGGLHWGMIALAAAVAAITAFISVKWLLRFIQSHTFEGFGWYRIILGVLILAVFR